MKKSILAIAVAATMAAPAAIAAPTVYGNVHLSLNQADNDIPDAKNNLSVSSNTSALGVKGSEDLGDGLKAIYKLEFGVTIGPKPTTDPDSDYLTGGESAVGALTGRDQFVGLKGGFGAIKFGTMSSNYKQMGGKVDPMYRTVLEGRGFMNMQSGLHAGASENGGRSTNT
ncbi:MAG: porin, partial [Gammaproteobacteria bacterium]|nr:porin [Gammaproteobacteria bacterium]